MVSKKTLTAVVLIVIVAVVLGYYAYTTIKPVPEKKVLKVAWMVDSVINDQGWGTVQYQTLRNMQNHFGKDKVEIAFTEGLRAADFPRVARGYCEEGFDLIWIPCAGHGPMMLDVARAYPNVKFIIGAMGPGDVFPAGTPEEEMKIPENLQCLFECASLENYYLAGLLAGSLTKTNKIGWVDGEAFPLIISMMRAFEFGVKEMNPDATVLEYYVGSWIDPVSAREATLAMIDKGADVMCQYGSPTGQGVYRGSEERGIPCVGSELDQSFFFADVVFCSVVQDYTNVLINEVQAIFDGTWRGGMVVKVGLGTIYKGGTETVPCKLGESVPPLVISSLGEKILPEDAKQLVKARMQQIIDGTFVVPVQPT